ncbi:hypothetical protein DLAC_10050 [Tieghemostelium lacteum]|uniref:Transmembrane protein n=1 Tax=Tieghemostelium lacteum TaxID=361077 RepID=A0A151Z605_TIELA|nr:hypothetical protein DLAC_10050 [Tieghemostelium lacteum]|eukprot:KYQ89390.1 hypothetical protein DLAC_10050 [Tieghemostelium lacteum]
MKSIITLTILLISLSTIFAQSYKLCTTTADCYETNSYCRLVPGTNNSVCAECRSNNDCAMDEYCSKNNAVGFYGTCTKFSKIGDSCIAFTDSDLEMNNITSTLKCADTYVDNTNNFTLTIDYLGFCTKGKCRMCNYKSTSTNSQTTPGKGDIRTCIYPGTYVSPHSSQWSSKLYYENPTNVWLAIFFCLIMIQIGLTVVMFFFKK